jgi:hypothetical protein
VPVSVPRASHASASHASASASEAGPGPAPVQCSEAPELTTGARRRDHTIAKSARVCQVEMTTAVRSGQQQEQRSPQDKGQLSGRSGGHEGNHLVWTSPSPCRNSIANLPPRSGASSSAGSKDGGVQFSQAAKGQASL